MFCKNEFINCDLPLYFLSCNCVCNTEQPEVSLEDKSAYVNFAWACRYEKAILVTSRNRTGENGKATNAIDIVGLIDSY
jgi:hypothetical protein